MAYAVFMLDDGTVLCGDAGLHEVVMLKRQCRRPEVLVILTNGWILDDGTGADATRCEVPLCVQMSRVLNVSPMPEETGR